MGEIKNPSNQERVVFGPNVNQAEQQVIMPQSKQQ